MKLHGTTKPLGEHGGDRKSEDVFHQGDNITLKERGTTAAYLAARLKRDFPEIAEKLAAGEFRSVRAAAFREALLVVRAHAVDGSTAA